MFTALIVDADAEARAQIEFVLRPYGLQIYGASSVKEATAFVEKATPDIVFLRTEPSGVGNMAFQTLSGRQNNRAPILLYRSGKSGETDAGRPFIGLPIQPQELLVAVRKVLPLPSAEMAAFIRRGLDGWSEAREQVRTSAIHEAQKLIASKLGKLERGDFERVFQLFNTDFRDGKSTRTRFGSAFSGALAKQLLDNLPALNRWTERLWQADTDDDVARTLDEFWKVATKELPGAGQSYPSVLLHVRNPERFWPLTDDGTGAGYKRLTGKEAGGRKGANYLAYVRWIRNLRRRYELSAHAVDLALAAAPQIEEAGAVSLELVTTFTHHAAVRALAWSPNELLLASGAVGDGMVVWDVAKGTRRLEMDSDSTVVAIAWSPLGNEIVSRSRSRLEVRDAKTGEVLSGQRLGTTTRDSLALAPDGSRFAIGRDRALSMFGVRDADELRYQPGHDDSIAAVAWSKSDLLASGSVDGSVSIMKGRTGAVLHTFDACWAGVLSLAWSPVEDRLAIGGNDNSLTIVNADGQGRIATAGHSKPVTSVVWSSDGRWLASGASDGIHIWNALDGLILGSAQLDTITLACSGDGRYLAAGSGTAVHIWRVHFTSASEALRPDESPMDEPPTQPPATEPPPAPQPAADFTLALDLRLVGQRTCNVRPHGTTTWPDEGAPLPNVSELESYEHGADPAELDALGRQLFAALFVDSILAQYRTLRTAAEQANVSLRIVLRFHPDADQQQLCSIARHYWEALVDPDQGPMAIDQRLRLIRKRAHHDSLPPPRPTPKLRADIGFALPFDHVQLDLHHEFTSLRRLQQQIPNSKILDMRFHQALDHETLRACIHETDLFHFAGHGEAGGLLLEGRDRRSQPLVANALRALLTAPLPRMVILNACFGSVSKDDWISVAEAFLDRGVQTVVAMNGPIHDDAALAFADELHKRLAGGDDVEHAVQQARWRTFAESTPTWFMPVLWTRTEQSFVLLDPRAARLDPSISAAVELLDEHAASLRPRVTILQRVARQPITAVERNELAKALWDQVESSPDSETELEQLLGSEAELERQITRIRRKANDPLAELREAASIIPGLVEAMRVMVGKASPAPVAVPTPAIAAAAQAEIPDYPFAPSEALTSDETLDQLVVKAKGNLVIDDEPVRRCLIHLLAGRHLVLAGPPGTGKSTLAKGLAGAFGFTPRFATANPDWTTFDTIGGLAPVGIRDAEGRSHVSYPFQPGCVLRAVDSNWEEHEGQYRRRTSPESRGTWLVIDEMNRAPLDQAFGDMFTALVDHEIRDPRRQTMLRIPLDFRLIGTANTADRRLLFEFSEALKRRFAFVEIPAFSGNQRGLGDRDKLLEQVRNRGVVEAKALDADFDAVVEQVEQIVTRLRVLHPLGLAQVLDILTFVAVGRSLQPGKDGALLSTALVDNLGPALEAQPAPMLETLAALLDGTLDVWLQRFIGNLRHSHRPDPTCRRIAAELLRQLAGRDVSFSSDVDWAQQLEDHAPALTKATPALPHCEHFAARLRRFAAERDV